LFDIRYSLRTPGKHIILELPSAEELAKHLQIAKRPQHRLRHLDPGETCEVDTPNLAFAIKRVGNYKIEANQDNSISTITVFQGEGEVIGGGLSKSEWPPLL
jgi:hypothetical protein